MTSFTPFGYLGIVEIGAADDGVVPVRAMPVHTEDRWVLPGVSGSSRHQEVEWQGRHSIRFEKELVANVVVELAPALLLDDPFLWRSDFSEKPRQRGTKLVLPRSAFRRRRATEEHCELGLLGEAANVMVDGSVF